MIVITVANNKGGTGKTTLAVHLAIALAKMDFKTLIIDNDTQCNTTKLLVGHVVSQYSMYHLLTNPSSLCEKVIAKTDYPRLSCMPNETDVTGLSLSFAETFPNCLFKIREALQQVKDLYDYVIIDCPPTMDFPVSMACVASNGVVVPVDAGSVHSLDGLDSCLDLIDSIRSSYNPGLNFLKLVINKSDKRTSISKTIIEDIKTKYPGKHFKTIFSVCTGIQQAEYLGKALYKHQPTSNYLKNFKSLATEMITELQKIESL